MSGPDEHHIKVCVPAGEGRWSIVTFFFHNADADLVERVSRRVDEHNVQAGWLSRGQEAEALEYLERTQPKPIVFHEGYEKPPWWDAPEDEGEHVSSGVFTSAPASLAIHDNADPVGIEVNSSSPQAFWPSILGQATKLLDGFYNEDRSENRLGARHKDNRNVKQAGREMFKELKREHPGRDNSHLYEIIGNSLNRSSRTVEGWFTKAK